MIAEHLLGGVLALLHNFIPYRDAQARHSWHEYIPADTISGKRITVLGAGRIGQCFARKAAALGALVTGVSLNPKLMPEGFVSFCQIDRLREILPQTDILVMTLPHTSLTEKIIGAKELALLPQGAYLLNVGRGKTLDESALSAELKSGHLAGGLCDVFEEEPLPKSSPLWDIPNFLITPHVAGQSDGVPNQLLIADIIIENMKHWTKGEQLTNIVDVKKGF